MRSESGGRRWIVLASFRGEGGGRTSRHSSKRRQVAGGGEGMPAVYMHDAGLFFRHTLRTGTAVGNTRPKHPSPIHHRSVGETRPSQADPRSSRQEPSKGKGRNSCWDVLTADQACAPHNWDPFHTFRHLKWLPASSFSGRRVCISSPYPACAACVRDSLSPLTLPLVFFIHTFRRTTCMDSVTRCGACSEGLCD